jgi:hypothetical protein
VVPKWLGSCRFQGMTSPSTGGRDHLHPEDGRSVPEDSSLFAHLKSRVLTRGSGNKDLV